MNNELEMKQLMVEIGKRIWMRGYVASNDGNFTFRLNDHELLTTPTGVSKGFMTTDMIIKVDNTGTPVTPNPKYKPSSEVKMHLEVYKERPDVNAVVHAHPQYATSFAVAGIPLDKCVLPEAILSIGSVPIAKYGLPSSMEIPESISEYVKKTDAILLANHGALTLGSDLLNAYHKMETLEHTASIVWKALQLGNLNVLSEYEKNRLMDLKEKFNMPGKVMFEDMVPLKPAESGNEKKVNAEVSEELIAKIVEIVLQKQKK